MSVAGVRVVEFGTDIVEAAADCRLQVDTVIVSAGKR